MTPLRQRMLNDMQLHSLSPKTQEAYTRVVRQLAAHYGKSPDQISEEELRDYFLYLKNEKKVSRSASTVALCGIKFFFEHTFCCGRGLLQVARRLFSRQFCCAIDKITTKSGR